MPIYLGDYVEIVDTNHPELQNFNMGDVFVVIGADTHQDGNIYLYLKNSDNQYVNHVHVKYVKYVKRIPVDDDATIH